MSRFGDFTLLEDLGRSAVADRYKAVHASLGGPFFLKTFTRLDVRFHAEVNQRGDRLIGKTHGNLAAHFGHGVVGGIPFVVSPWLDGIDLVELSTSLKDRRVNLTLDHCLIILVELARGIEALHQMTLNEQGFWLAHGDVSLSHVRLGPDGNVWLTGLCTPRGLEPDRGPEARFDLAGVGALLYDLLPLLRGGAARPPLPVPLDRVIRRALGIGPLSEHLSAPEFIDRICEVGESLKLNLDHRAFIDVVRRTMRAIEKKQLETGGRPLIGGRAADAIPELVPVIVRGTLQPAALAPTPLLVLEPLKPSKTPRELAPWMALPVVLDRGESTSLPPLRAPMAVLRTPPLPAPRPFAEGDLPPTHATPPATLGMTPVSAGFLAPPSTPAAPPQPLSIDPMPTPRRALFSDDDEGNPPRATLPSLSPPHPSALPSLSEEAIGLMPKITGFAVSGTSSPSSSLPQPSVPPPTKPPVPAPLVAAPTPFTFPLSASTPTPLAFLAAEPSPGSRDDTDPDAVRPARIEAQKSLPAVQALLKAGVIDAAQLERAATEQAQRGGRTLEILVTQGIVGDDTVAAVLARSSGRPVIAAHELIVTDVGLLRRIPQTYALARRLLPLSITDGTLVLAVADPFEIKVIEEVKTLLHATAVNVKVAERKALTESTLSVFGTINGTTIEDSGPRVLLCIQDTQKAENLGGRLAQEGMQVEHVIDGHLAKKILAARPPTAVICSHDLPGLDGRALLLLVRDHESTAELPFFVLGPRSEDDLIARLLDLGADDFFGEPLRLDVVLAKLRRAIDKNKRHELSNPGRPAPPPLLPRGPSTTPPPPLGSSGDFEFVDLPDLPPEVDSGTAEPAAMPTGVMGTLRQMALAEIVQSLEMGRKTASVDIVPQDGDKGMIGFEGGSIRYAECGGLVGQAAFFALMRHKDGYFRIHYGDAPPSVNIDAPTTFLLLEAMRLMDEEGFA